jgi:hypothetical protein
VAALIGVADASFYLEQADRFDRVADQCAVADLVPYYRQLAEAYRRMAGVKDPHATAPRGQPSPIEFPEQPERAPRDCK